MTSLEAKIIITSATKNIMTTSDKIALASFITAFFSFVVTIVIIIYTNQQNRLSVKPILKIIPYDFENNIAIYIKNVGVGPLFRNKLEFKTKTETASNLIDLMPKHSTLKWTNFSRFPDFVIPVNEQEILIELKGDLNNNEFNEFKTEVRKALKEITIYCDYADIYNTKFKSKPENLDYCYGRHFK
ncbi:hypothetical protein [Flavobacterium sp. FlaQc-47]|uniref:hypothetical protein n=1 Tax=Flavobacterium sp. FlaQc-47 TaxID=3374180 RepID=UPI0037574BEC